MRYEISFLARHNQASHLDPHVSSPPEPPVVGPFVLPDARPSSKQKAPRGKETLPSKLVLRKQQNEVLPAVKPLCLVFPVSTPMKGQTLPVPPPINFRTVNVLRKIAPD